MARRQRQPREVLEDLLRRRGLWRGGPPLPIVTISGPGDTGIKAAEFLARPFHEHVTFAAVSAGQFSDLTQLIEHLAGEDGRFGASVRGAFLPAPRFPLAQFVLWVLRERDREPEGREGAPGAGAWPPAADSPAGQREFRERLRRWRWEQAKGTRRALVRSADFVARAAPTWVPAGILTAFGASRVAPALEALSAVMGGAVGVVGTLVQAWLFIRGSIFTRWFRRQPYLTRKPFESLPKYGLRLAAESKKRPDQIERLLVLAMLEDLRQAYRWRFPIPWPSWGRGLHCLLVLERSATATANNRFLEVLRTVVTETGAYAPMVVLVGETEDEAGTATEAGTGEGTADAGAGAWARVETRKVPEDALTAFDALTARWRREADLRVPPLTMRLRASAEDLQDEPYRFRAHHARARAFAYWAVVLALISAPLAYGVFVTSGCGLELREMDRQCVGVGTDIEQMGVAGPLRDVLRAITAENEKIPADAPTAKVYFMGPLTTGRQPPANELNGELAQLIGLLARQRRHNGDNDWKIRIEFANTGADFRGARYAAEAIRDRARRDDKVAAVIGLALSREETRKAVDILSRAQIPMLATTNTANLTPIAPTPGDKAPSRYFRRMAAPNSAQAMAMRWWLDRGLAETPAGGPGPVRPGPRADRIEAADVRILWQQDGEGRDIYSRDLKEQLLADKEWQPVAQAFSDTGANTLPREVEIACGANPKVIIYTGHARDLRKFLNEVHEKCDPRVRLLMGDEVTDAIAVLSSEKRSKIYFVALTRQDGDRPSNKDIDRVRGFRAISHAHAELAYDALAAVGDALEMLTRQHGGGGELTHDDAWKDLDLAAGVHDNLIGLYEDMPVHRASGSFYLPSRRPGNTAVPRTLWLTVAEAERPGSAPDTRTVGRCEYEGEDESGGSLPCMWGFGDPARSPRADATAAPDRGGADGAAEGAAVVNPSSRERARPR